MLAFLRGVVLVLLLLLFHLKAQESLVLSIHVALTFVLDLLGLIHWLKVGHHIVVYSVFVLLIQLNLRVETLHSLIAYGFLAGIGQHLERLDLVKLVRRQVVQSFQTGTLGIWVDGTCTCNGLCDWWKKFGCRVESHTSILLHGSLIFIISTVDACVLILCRLESDLRIDLGKLDVHGLGSVSHRGQSCRAFNCISLHPFSSMRGTRLLVKVVLDLSRIEFFNQTCVLLIKVQFCATIYRNQSRQSIWGFQSMLWLFRSLILSGLGDRVFNLQFWQIHGHEVNCFLYLASNSEFNSGVCWWLS